MIVSKKLVHIWRYRSAVGLSPHHSLVSRLTREVFYHPPYISSHNNLEALIPLIFFNHEDKKDTSYYTG